MWSFSEAKGQEIAKVSLAFSRLVFGKLGVPVGAETAYCDDLHTSWSEEKKNQCRL